MDLFATARFRENNDYSWTVCLKPRLGTSKKQQKLNNVRKKPIKKHGLKNQTMSDLSKLPAARFRSGPRKVEVQAKFCSRRGCKRQFAGDSRDRVPKNVIFNQNGAKRPKMEPKWYPKRPKWSPKGANKDKMEPKGAPRDQNGTQRVPKGSQMEPKGCQKGAKGRPKCIKKSMSEKGRQKGHCADNSPDHLGSQNEQFSIKNGIKNPCKNRCRKSDEN